MKVKKISTKLLKVKNIPKPKSENFQGSENKNKTNYYYYLKVEKVKIFNEIILKVKNFSLSFHIFLKGKISKT